MTSEKTVTTDSDELIKTLLSNKDMDSSIWKQTLTVVITTVSIPNVHEYTLDELSKYKKDFNSEFTAALPTIDIPQHGYNRKGEKIILRKKDGSIKWSSWAASARMMQNLSEISTACFYDIPFGYTTSRGELLKLIKNVKDTLAADKAMKDAPPPVAPGFEDKAEEDDSDMDDAVDTICSSLLALASVDKDSVLPRVEKLYMEILELGKDND